MILSRRLNSITRLTLWKIAVSDEYSEIPCPRCGAYTRIDRIFCLRCRHRIIPLTQYDLAVEDFIYPPDKDGIESIKDLEPLPQIIKHLLIERKLESLRSQLARGSIRVKPLSSLGSIIRRCGIMLGLRVLPESFIIQSETPQAFTFGTDEEPVLVISSSMLEIMNEKELEAVVAHELGHVKSGHLVYHTLAELLVRGASLSLSLMGLDLAAEPLRLLLLAWHRDSEISADRASLLVTNDLEVIKSMFSKLIRYSEGGFEGILDSVSELFKTHPTYLNRIEKLEEFYNSVEFRNARAKIERRITLLNAISPICRFCGARKPLLSLFCPSCGRSQI